MIKCKMLVAGFFVYWGTLCFLRMVGQELQNQRRRLEAERKREEDEERMAALRVPIAKPSS